MKRCVSSLLCWIASIVLPPCSPAQAPVDYSRDIRPILAGSCYACHGPDEGQRKGKLRLDLRNEAIKKAIVPGNAADSVLFQRIVSKESEEVMPPPHSKRPAVTPDQAKLIERWIQQGAKYDMHWAYVKPVSTPIPGNKNEGWIRTPVDAFIAAEHARLNVTAAPESDRNTLLRRLSFDLNGLPPTRAEMEAFLADNSPQAYERVVDRLLASPHYGERMAIMWLDVVRYADTGGYHSDNHRDIWMYRNYVINAFNSNKPFDQFTVEQLAGDLLPQPSNETRIASGYNRLLMTTEEGGAQPKEYTAKYAADRVRNTSNTWLGATLGCAECHNHKYDPYTTRDFYRFAAFFADVTEKAVGRQDQTMIMTAKQEELLTKMDAAIAKYEAELAKPSPALDDEQLKWEEQRKLKKDGTKGLPQPVVEGLQVEPAKRSAAQKQILATHFRLHEAPSTQPVRLQLAALRTNKDLLTKIVPSTLISMAGPPRTVRVLPRGNWLDETGESVHPDVPSFLGKVAPTDPRLRATRLDLAKWITSPENPLTARVYVNRLWKIAFGQGIVKNLDDLGTQGTLPSHPALLDWLATEFIKSGWNTKAMIKMIVMSNTYRQSSVQSKLMRERDPSNFWLTRQNSFRLDAEFVRDNALSVSGLLVPQIGGPSVKPYQPAGFWSYLNFPAREWQSDKGDNQYRRGLYTYWCRSFLHPSLFAFDAPTREECTNERSRSSTPLQALILLNDPTYVEAARVLAHRLLTEAGDNDQQRIDWLFRQVLSRSATATEQGHLSKLYVKHYQEYCDDIASALKLLTVGDRTIPTSLDPIELAAWTSVTRVMLNLHETTTRR